MMKRYARWLTHPATVAGVIAVVLTGLLYVGAVFLPLFSDDLVQIPWLESISWRQLWTGPSPYGYYRPLWYTLWRGWGWLVGGLHPTGLHVLNLVAHVVATFLTGVLAANWLPADRVRRDRAIAAGCAATFFVVFPFSRQAVAWPGAVYNPIVSGLTAGAVLAYDSGRGRHSGWRIGLALLLVSLGPLFYESGILAAPLLLLVELIGRLRARWESRSSWPLAFVGVFVITLAFWRFMRGAGVTPFGVTVADLWHNGGYLVQGLIYPLAPVAQRVVEWTGFDSALGIWLLALPTVLVLGWWGLRQCSDLLLLGMAWFGLFALPPLVSMEADWFALAPRFLYMTAAGVSLVWTAALLPRIANARGFWQTTTIVLLLGALLVPAGLFVRDGLHLYSMAGESIWGAAAAVTEGQRVLLVNLPRRITPEGRLYPLGFEGVTPLPMRVTAEGLAYVHTGVRDGAEAVAFGVVATEQPENYTYELFGTTVGWQEVTQAIRSVDTVYLTRYEPDRIHLFEAGGVDPAPVAAGPTTEFGEHVELLDAVSSCDRAGRVRLTAWWRVRSAVEVDASVYAHLLEGSHGSLVNQADGRPLLGMLPFWLIDEEDLVRDVRHLGPVPSGSYTVQFGLWEPATGERWPAKGHPDGIVTLSVECP